MVLPVAKPVVPTGCGPVARRKYRLVAESLVAPYAASVLGSAYPSRARRPIAYRYRSLLRKSLGLPRLPCSPYGMSVPNTA
eukprot:3940877-Rhodomonas_salina.2